MEVLLFVCENKACRTKLFHSPINVVTAESVLPCPTCYQQSVLVEFVEEISK